MWGVRREQSNVRPCGEKRKPIRSLIANSHELSGELGHDGWRLTAGISQPIPPLNGPLFPSASRSRRSPALPRREGMKGRVV
jgi:hypothetical protein